MKYAVSAMFGVLAALALFLLMHQMLGSQSEVLPPKQGPIAINLPIRVIPDEIEPPVEPPPEPEPLKPPPEAPRLELQAQAEPVSESLDIEFPDISPEIGGGLVLPGANGGTGQEALAPGSSIVIQPVYPGEAIRRGLEGFVTLEIDLAADGSVIAARVVDSEPGRVFDAAALKAAYRSRFAPAASRGESGARRVVQTVYFKLEDEN